MENNDVYTPKLSLYTNKPVIHTEHPPVFWCKTCKLKLRNTYLALQHCRGRPHKAKMTANRNTANQSNQKEATKHIHLIDNSNVRQEPSSMTKVKPATARIIQCDLCNLTFTSTLMSLQHFQGRRHAEAKRSHVATINVKKSSANQNNQNDAPKHTHLLEWNRAGHIVPAVQMFHGNMSPVQSGKTNLPDANVKCITCDVVFNSIQMATQHYQGKRHATTMQSDDVTRNAVDQNNEEAVVKHNNLLEFHVRQAAPVSQGSIIKNSKEQPAKTIVPMHHESTTATQNQTNQNDTECAPKRKHLLDLDDGQTGDSPTKKIKDDPSLLRAPERSYKCEDCNIEFMNEISATQHFQGKRHAKTLSANKLAMQNETMSRWQNRDAISGVSRWNRGNTRGGVRKSVGDLYRNSLHNLTPVSSNILLRKAIIPGKLSLLMNTVRTVKSGHSNGTPPLQPTAYSAYSDVGMHGNGNQSAPNSNNQTRVNINNGNYYSKDYARKKYSAPYVGYQSNVDNNSSASFGNR